VIDLYDPDTYAIAVPHAALAELRRTDPVHWQDIPGGTGYWSVLRHADVVHVARTPRVFSASAGGVVLEDLDPEQLAMMRHMLLAMDPPIHDEHRRPLAPTFGARVIGAMEDRIRAIVGDILDSVGDGDLELVHDVCGLLPSRVVGDLMGLPPDDEPRIRRWAELMTGSQDTEVVGGDDTTKASIEMAMYAIELAARRRAEPPRDDLTSLLLESTFDGEPMSDVDFGSFFVQLVTAGNDTTRTMLSSGTLALVEHPGELAALRADRGLIPSAVEEILRWANPLHYFRRTATEDTEISGVRISAGDKVAMIYTSANRDDDVFDDPDRFDVRRDPNPHLSFGIGGHFCLGAHVARLEGRVFFEELLDRFVRFEVTGEPRRVRSNLNNGLRALPMRLVRP
jgi:cytochrome P450